MSDRYVVYRTDRLSDGTSCVVATHPELPGCFGFGEDGAAARASLAEAREAYIASMVEDAVASGIDWK